MKIAPLLLLALLAGPATAQAPPPVPALPDSPRLTSYSLSGTTCACSVGWAIYGDGTDVDNWIDVFLNGVSVLSTDPAHGWSLSSATGALGSIPRPITNAVLTFAQPQTGNVTIVGARRPRRLTQFQENRGVTARDLNQVITDEIAMLRETWDKLNGALVGQPGEVLRPLPSSRAGQFLAFDSSGQPIVTAQQTSIVTDGPIIGSKTLSLTNSAPLPVVDLATSPPINGFYASGSGAIFSTCPLTYAGGCTAGAMAITYAAQYLKGTAVKDSTIAEYMVINDCNLNSGKGGAGVGTFNDSKVCQYNNVTTGANAGTATWVQANNLVIGAGDNNPIPPGMVPAKFNTELDITNDSPDCAVAVKNCYNLILSGLTNNPITAELSISPNAPLSGNYAAHYGILLNGTNNKLASDVDIENSGSASFGICNGCLTPQTHAVAAFRDVSTTINGFEFAGTYSGAAIHLLAGAKICFEVTNSVCQSWNGTSIVSTFTVAAPYLQTAPNNIGGLAACTGALAGLRSSVSNGVASPTLGSIVSATGAVWQPVSCNGTNWVYG